MLHHDQVGFNTGKFVSINHPINIILKNNHLIISLDAGKSFNKI